MGVVVEKPLLPAGANRACGLSVFRQQKLVYNSDDGKGRLKLSENSYSEAELKVAAQIFGSNLRFEPLQRRQGPPQPGRQGGCRRRQNAPPCIRSTALRGTRAPRAAGDDDVWRVCLWLGIQGFVSRV